MYCFTGYKLRVASFTPTCAYCACCAKPLNQNAEISSKNPEKNFVAGEIVPGAGLIAGGVRDLVLHDERCQTNRVIVPNGDVLVLPEGLRLIMMILKAACVSIAQSRECQNPDQA